MKQPAGLSELGLLDPVVVDLDSVSGDQVLNILLGMIDLPGVGNLPLKVQPSALFNFSEKTRMRTIGFNMIKKIQTLILTSGGR